MGQWFFANKLLGEIRREQYDRENVTPVELLSSTRKQEIEAKGKAY